MRNLFSFFIFFLLVLGLHSCTNKEDLENSNLKEDVENLSKRVSALEQLCAQQQTNIQALQVAIDAMAKNEYITNVSPICEGDMIIGYTITFSQSGSITLYNGIDGTSSSVGAKKDVDNVYYWTVDGEWLLDSSGNKIPVKGITPKLKIEDGQWYVSIDDGQTWTPAGPSQAALLFSGIEDNKDSVVFILSDGTRFTVQKKGFFTVEQSYYAIGANSSHGFYFPVVNWKDDYVVDAYVVGYEMAETSQVDFQDHSSFYVSAELLDNKYLYLYLQTPKNMPSRFEVRLNLAEKPTEDGITILQSEVIQFEKVDIEDNLQYVYLSCEEQVVSLSVPTNAYNTDLMTWGQCDWIEYVKPETKSSFKHNESHSIKVQANTGELPRFLALSIQGSGETICEYLLLQCGTEKNVAFIDSEIRRICTELFDSDKDGFVSYEEAFNCKTPYYKTDFTENEKIETFDELQYFPRLSYSSGLMKGCVNLKHLTFPPYLDNIAYDLFKDCESLSDVILPNGVKKIGWRAFEGTGITTITIPSSVKEIGHSAFKRCLELEEVTFEEPITVNDIPESMFEGCAKLKKVNGKKFSSTGAYQFSSIGARAFKDTDLSKPVYANILGDYAFYNSGLGSYDVSRVESLGNFCFANCKKLHFIDACQRYDVPGGFGVFIQDDGRKIDSLRVSNKDCIKLFEEAGWTKYFKRVFELQWASTDIIVDM